MSNKKLIDQLKRIEKKIQLWNKIYLQVGTQIQNYEQTEIALRTLSVDVLFKLEELDPSDPITRVKKFWKLIQNMQNLRLPLDEQQDQYLSLLRQFMTAYEELSEKQAQEREGQKDYVQGEITKTQNRQNNKQPNVVGNLINRRIAAAARNKRFRITTGFDKEGRTLARIEYMYTPLTAADAAITNESDGVVIDYWEYIPNADGGEGSLKIIRSQVRVVSGELTTMLIDLALKQLEPAPQEMPSLGELSMHDSGSYYLSIVRPAEVCPDFHILIQDSQNGAVMDTCNNIASININRIATKIPNPNCDRQRMDYQGLFSNTQAYNPPPINYNRIPDGTGDRLPATTVASPAFNREDLTTYFNNNSNEQAFVQVLNIPVTPPPIIASGTRYPIAITYWTAQLVNPAAALATLRPVIDFLNYYCDRRITVLGGLDTTNVTDPFNGGYAMSQNIPANVINPVDYIFVKGEVVANLIINSGLLLRNEQVIISRRGSISPDNLPMGADRSFGLSVGVLVD